MGLLGAEGLALSTLAKIGGQWASERPIASAPQPPEKPLPLAANAFDGVTNLRKRALRIALCDLAGFSSLTDAMGDQAAATVLERFAHIVRQSVGGWDGRIVKQIDSFMVVFLEARLAGACALEIERLVAREPQFAAVRSGVHYGPVLYREGDYVGTSVNVAARFVAE